MDEQQEQDLLKQVADLKALVEQQRALLLQETTPPTVSDQANMADAQARNGRPPVT